MALTDYQGTPVPLNYDVPSPLRGTTQRFQVKVNCAEMKAEDESAASTLNDGYGEYTDEGFIMLPDSYMDSGRKTRLVISCHGAGGTVTTNDSQVEKQTLTKYLVANGYAVMDMAGLPAAFAAAKGIDAKNNIGSYIALQCYIRGYHHCVERFNLYPEVFLMGASMGGISSTNLCLSGAIPVIAQAGYCPVLDTYHEIFLKPWSNGLPKTALGILYGLDRDDSGAYVYDESKLRGYNPVKNRTVEVEGVSYTFYPVPVKFWQCANDPIVSYAVTKAFVESIQNAGGIAYLRTFATGGHEPQDVGTAVSAPTGNTVFRGEKLSVKPAVEEVLLWFNRFN